LHVYGDHTALLVDTGLPPLQLTKYVHLAKLHLRLRLTISRSGTLPALLFELKTAFPLSKDRLRLACIFFSRTGIYGVHYLRTISYFSMSQCAPRPARESKVCPGMVSDGKK